jgi:hypothetical protein
MSKVPEIQYLNAAIHLGNAAEQLEFTEKCLSQVNEDAHLAAVQAIQTIICSLMVTLDEERRSLFLDQRSVHRRLRNRGAKGEGHDDLRGMDNTNGSDIF